MEESRSHIDNPSSPCVVVSHDILQFPPLSRDQSSVYFTITSSASTAVCFKIKTTHVQYYTVKPPSGVLRPTQSATVQVTLTIPKSHPTLPSVITTTRPGQRSLDPAHYLALPTHKFKVQALPTTQSESRQLEHLMATDGDTTAFVKDMWSRLESVGKSKTSIKLSVCSVPQNPNIDRQVEMQLDAELQKQADLRVAVEELQRVRTCLSEDVLRLEEQVETSLEYRITHRDELDVAQQQLRRVQQQLEYAKSQVDDDASDRPFSMAQLMLFFGISFIIYWFFAK
eukprot:gnl/Dysnectes_brevis/1662_a1891_1563.p1 GENE.gnl/Dysnectes_brevis/1662_a1891_1563~~gnl/Dysnectes_brevis/1662_a1891_1563.p1  ORF type:complete len:284 (-),score=65.17 gnl/Dysnectes_brevis/1662_a1891_1563:35-886(-)